MQEELEKVRNKISELEIRRDDLEGIVRLIESDLGDLEVELQILKEQTQDLDARTSAMEWQLEETNE